MSSTTSPENGRSNRLTIRQVADLAGVSTATVSRVINGRTEVSDRAREAVLRVVREHGYSTNRTARGLSAGRTGLVGVTTPVVHHSYFAVILDGAGEALYEQDMRMVLCPTHHEHEREVVAARAPDAGHDRRRAADPARGVAATSSRPCTSTATRS